MASGCASTASVNCTCSVLVTLVNLNEFNEARQKYYNEYATTLASWGWAVLQYDLQCFQVPFGGPCPQLQKIQDEVDALPGVLAWAQDQTSILSPSAAGLIDWHNIIIGGHSRGAAVAARSAAAYPGFGPSTPLPTEPPAPLPGSCTGSCSDERPRVAAVLLVDPVAQTPVRVPLVSPREPHFAIVGMGSALCAPQRLGADNFLPGDAPPLEQAVRVPQAGHAQFWQAGRPWQGTYDKLCGTGSESDTTIRTWATRLLSSWLLQNFPPHISEEVLADAMDENEKWIAERVSAGDFQPWLRST